VATISLRLRAAGLRLGIGPNHSPLLINRKPETAAGFTVDLLRAIAADPQLNLEFVTKRRAAIHDDFRAGRIDLIEACGKDPECAPGMRFSVPTSISPGAYLPILSSPPPAGHTSRPRHSPNGPVTASLSEANAKRQGWVRQRICRSLPEALAALDRGEYAIVLADRVVAAHSIRTRNYLHVVATDLAALGLDQELHRAVHPSAPALLNRLNKGLAHLRENGTDQRIYDKRIRPLETRHLRSRDGQPYRLGLGARARDSHGLGGATPPAPSTRRKARRTAHARGRARSPT
jgi:ABC-type amino acid transport substrate-binding protein